MRWGYERCRYSSNQSLSSVGIPWDDTLVQTRQSRFAAIKALGARFYGRTLDDAAIEALWGKPFSTLFGLLFDLQGDQTDIKTEQYLSLTDEFPMLPHNNAVTTIAKLCDSDCVGIATAANRAVVTPELNRLGFPVVRLAKVQCAEDTTHHKPDARVFTPLLYELQQAGIAVHQITYISDSINDFLAASRRSLGFIGICRDSRSAAQLRSVGAKFMAGLKMLLGYNHQIEPTVSRGSF
jgi:phosphoglycolate phosphatase-like HAD superfamily hydrolase